MRIGEVILFTKQIKAQKHFYKDILGLEQLIDLPKEISFKVGASIITFRYKKLVKPSHLAFNIPSGSINEARSWLENRMTIIPSGEHYITNFENWNAKAIYFYDEDKNIMELIARDAINTKTINEFSVASIVSISEMAIATNNIEIIFNSINNIKPIPIFDGDFLRFCALGDDNGLFILIDKTKKEWYPTNDKAFTSEFIIKGDYNFSFEDGKIKELL
ncbi:hypothetical protein FBALC1_12837 [Flavobacteriales bacterium ALC-1]|nr:hypothetical protein FBALC1_12837 [Flavobacteriales bacterium ALC-1]